MTYAKCWNHSYLFPHNYETTQCYFIFIFRRKKIKTYFILKIRGDSSHLAGISHKEIWGFIPIFQYQMIHGADLEARKTGSCKNLWNNKFPEKKKLLIPEFLCSPCYRENPPLAAQRQKTCVDLPSDSTGYLVDDNAARQRLWEESQTLISFWSYAWSCSLAALWVLGNLETQSRACFWMYCYAGADAFVMATSTLWHFCVQCRCHGSPWGGGNESMWILRLALLNYFDISVVPLLVPCTVLRWLTSRFWFLLVRFWLGNILQKREISTSVALDTIISSLVLDLYKVTFSNKASKSVLWVWCIFIVKCKDSSIAVTRCITGTGDEMRSFC